MKHIIEKTLTNILYIDTDTITYSQLYCKIHKIKLIHNKTIINHKTPIEIGYCFKCQKEYTEYSDINPIYISNYEWIYNNYL